MAPVGEPDENDSGFGKQVNGEKTLNIWESILADVQESSTRKLCTNKNVVILGDNESGKTTLVSKLQGTEDPKKGSGVEYHYIDVKDDYREENTRLGVWTLDGDPHHTGLLRYTLTEETLPHTTVLLVTSMATPWNIPESLERWAGYLSEHIDRLHLSPERQKELEEAQVKLFQEYVEPDDGQTNRAHKSSNDEQVYLPLGETTLSANLGIPIIVVVTKSDAISQLEKEYEYRDEQFDFVQMYIRKFCLKYGASVFYMSVKENKNCDLFYRYLVHRIYGLPFNMPALVVERDALFIPSGWDNEKKIDILTESMTNIRPDDHFDNVITRPIQRKLVPREAEVIAEDEQVFLMKQQTLLSKAPVANPAARDSPGRAAQSVQKPVSSPRAATGSPGVTPSPKKGAQPPGVNDPTKAGEGVLANFFNSLLNKKTAGSPGSAASPKSAEEAAMPENRPDRSSVSRDAKAELDRMTRTKGVTSPTGATQNHSTS